MIKKICFWLVLAALPMLMQAAATKANELCSSSDNLQYLSSQQLSLSSSSAPSSAFDGRRITFFFSQKDNVKSFCYVLGKLFASKFSRTYHSFYCFFTDNLSIHTESRCILFRSLLI